MEKLGKYLRPYWWYIALSMFIKFLGAAAELTIPYLMEIILDYKVPAGSRRDIYLYGGLMLLCAAACLGFNVIANRMSAVSSGKITRSIRHDLFAKLENFSPRQMDSLTTSSAVSRLTSDTYNINQLLARTQRLGIRAPILLLGGIAMMVSMDSLLSLVLIALLPVIGVVVYYVTKISVPLYTKQQTVLDRVVGTVQENITGIRVIKALSKTDYEKERFRKVNQELTDIDRKAGSVSAITNPASTLVLNLGLTLVVVVGAYRVNGGAVRSGVIVAFLQYFTMILNAMLGITRIFVMFSKGQASANRVAAVLRAPEDLTVLPETQPEPNAPHIAFRDVTFSYNGREPDLQHISFTLEHGQTLGIIGATGSGKTTLLLLLLRLYDPDSGTILIDGRDIRTIAPEVLREKFGVVFQNDFVAEGTAGDNIRFFRPIREEAMAAAAEHAQADFLRERPKGMEEAIQVRGNNLSGGQKQRLLIARALASNPEILILDDASSALDYATDARLRQALYRNYGDTTTVVVAQRVSSLRHADLILVLDDGQIIGAGTHEALMESCEEYRSIAMTQMGDGKEGT
ncbi:MAG: ABC transporter ATP-binding protein [Oscillospiraceae bacterium]|nr:ABC transporter ATP-binding protein [Oscillospiraceae bacterium]